MRNHFLIALRPGQSRGGDDEVMRQLQAAKARAATERKLKEKLRGMKESR